ncbi:class I SAM-dependent methyltransferase [Phenylobacterium sp.]|uniref:class I SAM-dependent methyltransferase n=1 Tax=Phenylobacterium sp. TaxID=1871053 RepID=UPI0030F44E20
MSEAPPTIEEELRIGLQRLREHMLNIAELTFDRVVVKAPENPVALRLAGVTKHKLGDSATALQHLRAATVLAPDVQIGWWDLSIVLRDRGEGEAAVQAHARAVSLLGIDPEAVPLPPLVQLSLSSDRLVHGFTMVDYPYTATVRYGSGRPAHPELALQIGAGRDRYAAFLTELGEIQGDFAQIPLGGNYDDSTPFWLNSWFPALDAMALTQMLRRYNPQRFVEIGSGLSTKFARRAVQTYGLRTKLASIDPEPRSEVDKLCDRVIRQPLERVDIAMFAGLEAGDILFLDSSHRSFQGSDVTVFFLEILPRLKSGVIVHIHDIYLPDDYLSGHLWRLWNEQYLLATALLFGGANFEILFPCWYIGRDPALSLQAKELLRKGPLSGVDLYGASFWMAKT